MLCLLTHLEHFFLGCLTRKDDYGRKVEFLKVLVCNCNLGRFQSFSMLYKHLKGLRDLLGSRVRFYFDLINFIIENFRKIQRCIP
jgi:hypothetical protein